MLCHVLHCWLTKPRSLSPYHNSICYPTSNMDSMWIKSKIWMDKKIDKCMDINLRQCISWYIQCLYGINVCNLLLRLDHSNSAGKGVNWGHSSIPWPSGIVTLLTRVDGGEAEYICSRLVTSSARTHSTTDICLGQ